MRKTQHIIFFICGLLFTVSSSINSIPTNVTLMGRDICIVGDNGNNTNSSDLCSYRTIVDDSMSTAKSKNFHTAFILELNLDKYFLQNLFFTSIAQQAVYPYKKESIICNNCENVTIVKADQRGNAFFYFNGLGMFYTKIQEWDASSIAYLAAHIKETELLSNYINYGCGPITQCFDRLTGPHGFLASIRTFIENEYPEPTPEKAIFENLYTETTYLLEKLYKTFDFIEDKNDFTVVEAIIAIINYKYNNSIDYMNFISNHKSLFFHAKEKVTQLSILMEILSHIKQHQHVIVFVHEAHVSELINILQKLTGEKIIQSTGQQNPLPKDLFKYVLKNFIYS